MAHYRGKRAKATYLPIILVLIACVAVALTAGASFIRGSEPDPDSSGASSEQQDMAGPLSAGPENESQSSPDAALPLEEEVPAWSPEVAAYDFTQPAPEHDPVENDYFDDAAFIGDSRTDGFMLYSGIGTGKNLTSNGLSIFKLKEKKALTIKGTEYTLLEALALEQYGKVYLSLGVNELGYHDDEGFYRCYCDAIDQIRALQPNAVIYIQGLIPVNEEKIAETTGRTYLNNEHLRTYNELMRKAAEEKQVVFLDLYTEFADENGSLPADASKDGVHLYKEYCRRWLDYLKTHTVDPRAVEPGSVSPEGGEQ